MTQNRPSQPSLPPQSPASEKSHAKKRSRKMKIFWRNVGAVIALAASLATILQFAGVVNVESLFYHPATPTPAPVKLPPRGTILYSQIATKWGGMLAWSPNGKRIANTNTDGTIQVWDATTGQHPIIYAGSKGKKVLALAWSHDSIHLASADASGTIQIWLADNGTTTFKWSIADIFELAGKQASNSGIDAIAWSPDDQQMALGDQNGDVVIVSLGEMVLRPYDVTILSKGQQPVCSNIFPCSLAWSPDGKQLAVSSYLSGLDLWNVASDPPQLVQTYIGGSMMSLAWSPNGKYIAAMAVLAYAMAARVWDTSKKYPASCSSQSPSLTCFPQQIPGQELSFAWACNSNDIALGSQNAVTIWDYAAQKAVYNFTNAFGVTSVAWSPDGTMIASGNGDGRILIWQASDQKLCGA